MSRAALTVEESSAPWSSAVRCHSSANQKEELGYTIAHQKKNYLLYLDKITITVVTLTRGGDPDAVCRHFGNGWRGVPRVLRVPRLDGLLRTQLKSDGQCLKDSLLQPSSSSAPQVIWGTAGGGAWGRGPAWAAAWWPWGGIRRRADAEGAGGIASAEDGRHPEVRGQAASSGISQGALLRHLRGQVGAYPGRVGVDEDADPDHRADLEARQTEMRFDDALTCGRVRARKYTTRSRLGSRRFLKDGVCRVMVWGEGRGGGGTSRIRSGPGLGGGRPASAGSRRFKSANWGRG
ncbi:hypothetical protein EYF80_049839 [Liparis tanakae]|uniref:Uncharacterized protein n=1 Tax=Liparis tanakae TaxID=230148 RepID=A0A4Z2FFH2_9TELE|nr:hypothetical protein EYF80_049839 [Liparis tanakae]